MMDLRLSVALLAALPGILFAVGDTWIDPFAYVSDGKLSAVSQTSDRQQFSERYYSHHHRYKLYSSGRASGSVEAADLSFPTPCERSLLTDALVTPSSAQMALATDAQLHDLGYTQYQPSDSERAAVIDLAEHVYTEHGVSPDHLRVSKLTAFSREPATLLIASFLVQHAVKAEDGPVDEAVFLIAERNATGHYEASHVWFHAGAESATQKQELVDVIDLTGTGFPDVVTRVDYSESSDYRVYRKSAGKWREVFQSSASGC